MSAAPGYPWQSLAAAMGLPFSPRGQLRRLIARDGKDCRLCLRPIDFVVTEGPQRWSIDHIVPRAKGGSGRLDNLQLAHQVCNGKKGSRMPRGISQPSR